VSEAVARVRALSGVAVFATAEGDWPTGRARSEESLALARAVGDPYFTAWTLRDLGFLAHFQGDYPEARRLYQESLAIQEQLGNLSGRASSLHQLGMLAQAPRHLT